MDIELMEFSLFAGVIVMLLTVVLVQAMQRRRMLATLQGMRRDIDTLQGDVRALCAGAHGTGAHLGRVDQQLMRLFERQDQFEVRDSMYREYDDATRLVRGGADLNEVMTRCRIGRAEAELLMGLHAPAVRSAA